MADIQRIDFHDREIVSWRDEVSGKVVASLKALCDPLGIQVTAQVERIRGNPLFAEGLVRGKGILTPGGKQDMYGFDITLIQLWLAAINSTRINEDKRSLLLLYQRECAQALHDYWAKGAAINPRTAEVTGPWDMLAQMVEAGRQQAEQIQALEAAQREQDHRLLAQQAQAIEALQQSTRAETKADLALEDAKRMTIEEFILKNGYFRQFPPSQWPGIARWLGTFCGDHGLRPEKTPVAGKHWPDELSYPIQALGRWLSYELHKPRQIHLVTPQEGAQP